MRILLFGCNGQVARCVQDEAQGKHEVLALSSTNTDLMQNGAAADAIKKHAPEMIINAAAYTAVDRAEDDKVAATRLNAAATAEIAKAAQKINAPFLHLSTDYVFDGDTKTPYNENDPTNPLNVYGASKLAGEKAALAENEQSLILRTSWVFSEYGANFVKTMLRLAGERNALSIIDDQIGGPTAARDIARALLAVAEKKHRGAPGAGVYHYQGAPAVSWAGFASKIFEIAGQNTTVTPIPTSAYPTPAKRPIQTILDCARIERDFGVAQPDWRIGLRQVIETLHKKDEQP